MVTFRQLVGIYGELCTSVDRKRYERAESFSRVLIGKGLGFKELGILCEVSVRAKRRQRFGVVSMASSSRDFVAERIIRGM